MAKAFAALDEVDRNPDLTAEGKAKERVKLAEKAVADFHKSNALEDARAAVARQNKIWDSKFGLTDIIKVAEDVHTATLHSEIRAKVSKMSQADRIAFLGKHGSDPLVASALLTAPSFISNIGDAEAAMIRTKLERSRIPPGVSEARADTEALASCERGWARAIQLVSERGGLKLQPVKTEVEAA